MNIAVIGAGASGMFFSILAAKDGHKVTVYEKNEKCGKKLYITGKGRCNLTNLSDNENFLKNVVSNPKFLYAAISNFSAEDTYRFFEGLNLKLKTERGQRVFPLSDKSSDVISALERAMRSLDVRIMLNSEVQALQFQDGAVKGIIRNNLFEAFDAVVVATGGLSYPSTGSTGDGFRFAEQTGHTVIVPKAALCELFVEFVNDFSNLNLLLTNLPSLQGLSLKNVSLSALKDQKIIAREFGEMLFTEKGISGPIALTLSSYLAKTDWNQITLLLDLKPALNAEQLDKRILREIESAPNKVFKNVIVNLLPSKLIPFFIKISGIDEYKEAHNLTKQERKRIVDLLKNIEFNGIIPAGFRSAVITSGGVCVKDINPKTMESKKIKGLYFIGEVLDVDALTGGFNLQIAFSTAYSAAKYLNGGK